ncbi:MAG: glycoside hydrolase family 3 C-terminal domain-containing protein, partial [Chitinophagaceae bacterium]
VDYVPGTGFNHLIDIAAAEKAASNADIIVLCLGESSYAENPGNINDLDISDPQVQLAKAMAKTGKPVILVLSEGRPRVISSFADQMNGILMTYYLGNEGGDAIAAVLYGDVNPSGKLPYTYPRYPNALFNYFRKNTADVDIKDYAGYDPQFKFGAGLSYTQFSYSHLQLSADTLKSGGTLTITVDVTNTGHRPGKEVVELYTSELYASITPDVKRLRGYQKISLDPGQTRKVTFQINKNSIAFVGQENKWVTETGEFMVRIAGLNKGFYYLSDHPQKEWMSGRID